MLTCLKEIAYFAGMSIHLKSFNPSTSGNNLKQITVPNYDNMVQATFIIQIILIFLLGIIAAITVKNWNTPKNAL